MAIKIVDSPDPLSEFSLLGDEPGSKPLLVESSASRILKSELDRYCRGMITGRSFLVAGHRGAGKTTLVAKAFMDVWQDAEKGAPMLRPLFIPLHGPSLFPSPTARLAAEPAKEDAKPKSEAQIALEQITLGLHRAVAREFAHRYRARAQTLAELRRTPNEAQEWLKQVRPPPNPGAPTEVSLNDPLPDEATLHALTARLPSERELFEIAGQFEAELQEGPPPQRLREFWERAHALSGGVLFRSGQAPRVGLGPTAGYETPSVPAGLFPNLVKVHGQGVRELVALAGVLEAYRRISGDYKRTEGEKASDAATTERTAGFSADAKELTTQIVSLLTGGLMATGLAVSGARPGITALGGIATALGAGVVFKATSTRKRERSTTRESQFVYDLSVATLDRVLPILIERLRGAGLAPVFVVDELDKVKELSARLVSMVHHLKKLVAENAFFCFLTNRSYFEEMLAQGSGHPYPVEYTYYTHRLFVVFAPEDFERYLDERIPLPPAPAPSSTAPASGSGTSTMSAAAPATTTEQTACAMLRWALRHRAQLHAVDLQREIAAIRGDKDEVSKSPDLITSDRRTLIDLTFQIGIELTLGRSEPEKVMLDRPEFRRLMHDAMYYLSRCWIDGVEEVDLISNDGLNAFRTYLETRTGREEERPNVVAAPERHATATSRWRRRELPSGSHEEKTNAFGSVSIKDADFLFAQVGELADFLSDRESVDQTGRPLREIRIDEWKQGRSSRKLLDLDPDLIKALLVGANASILQGDATRPGIYRFRHRVAGRPFVAQSVVTSSLVEPTPIGTPRDVGVPGAEVTAKAPIDAGVGPRPEGTAPPPATPRAAWEDQANLIDSFANMIRSVTRQEPLDSAAARGTGPRRASAVTLDAFATEYRLIPPTPTPAIALKAITNLRDAASRGTRQPPNDDDVFQIDQFARIVDRNGARIAQAIVLAAIIGRADQSRPVDEQIAVGLRVIAAAMRFAEKNESDVNTSLENIAAMISAAYGRDFEPALDGILKAWPDVAAVASIVQPAIAKATRLAVEPKQSLGERAWPTAHDRLNHWIKNNELLDAELDELLAAAAGVGPTEYIGLDPRLMTLPQWTQTLIKARDGQPHLVLYALNAMGFSVARDDEFLAIKRWARLPDGLGNVAVSTDGWNQELVRTHRLFLETSFFRRNPPITTIVVLRRSRSTIMGAYRPVPEIAALVVTGEELSKISESTTGVLQLPTTPNNVCAVEMETEAGISLYSHLFPFMQSMLRGPASVVFAYTSERPNAKQPSVVSPPDVRALVTRAIQAHAPVPTQ